MNPRLQRFFSFALVTISFNLSAQVASLVTFCTILNKQFFLPFARPSRHTQQQITPCILNWGLYALGFTDETVGAHKIHRTTSLSTSSKIVLMCCSLLLRSPITFAYYEWRKHISLDFVCALCVNEAVGKRSKKFQFPEDPKHGLKLSKQIKWDARTIWIESCHCRSLWLCRGSHATEELIAGSQSRRISWILMLSWHSI